MKWSVISLKLITKELEKLFEKYPIGSQDGLGGNAKVIAKFFNPMGVGTWLITEGNKLENGDYEMFGYCHLGDDEMAELGYVYLSELENLQLPYGMKIERDLYMPKDCDLIQAMKKTGITPPDYLLEQKENDENLEQNQDENDYDYDQKINEIGAIFEKILLLFYKKIFSQRAKKVLGNFFLNSKMVSKHQAGEYWTLKNALNIRGKINLPFE